MDSLIPLLSAERCQKCKASKGWTRCQLLPKCEEECVRHFEEEEARKEKLNAR